MKWVNKLQYFALYAMSFLLIGLTSFMAGGLGFGTFKESAYYMSMVLTYAAIICVIAATMMMLIDKFKTSDEEFVQLDKAIRNFAKNTYSPTVFSRYCEHTNEIRKLRQHVLDVKLKLDSLERKASDDDRLLWAKDKETGLKNGNKYCKAREWLEIQLTDSWVQANINVKMVKYDKITADVILAGVFDKGDMRKANDFITKNPLGRVAKDRVPMLLLSFGIMSFASALVVDFALTSSGFLVLIVKMFSLLFNAYVTVKYTNKWNECVTIKDARFRNAIINEYNRWVVANATKETEPPQNTLATKVLAEISEQQDTHESESFFGNILKNNPVTQIINDVRNVLTEGHDGRSPASKPSDREGT